jgi:hypothetical protein
MSILETRHSRSADESLDTDHSLASVNAPVSAPKATDVVVAPATPRLSRLARFFAAVRHSNGFATGGAAFADPRIYEEYRAGVARRDRDNDIARHA